MKDNIRARIKSYKGGLNVVRRMPTAQNRLNIVDLSEAKLDEIIASLEEVVDFSSPKALKKAEAVINKINEWAHITSQSRHSHETVQLLEDALDIVKNEWAKMNMPKKRFFGLLPPKVADITPIKFNELQESENGNLMVQISMSSSKLTSVIIFEDNLESRGNVLSEEFNRDMGELTAEKARNESQLAALEREKQNLNAQYQNGAIAKDVYLFKSKNLLAKVAELEKIVKVGTVKIAKREKQYAVENQINERLLKIIRSIKHYESQPQLITTLVKFVNFDALYNVMNGLGSTQDVNAIQIINVAETELERARKEINDQATQLFAGIDKEEMDAFLAELEEESLNADNNSLIENMTTEDEEEILRAMMGESAVPNSTNPVANTQTNVNNQPMMDDNIIY